MFKCIILDLDHTLIHAIHEINDEIKKHIVTIYCENKNYNLYLRNHLEDFLQFCFYNFEMVILWTAATDGYVELILPYLPIPNGKMFYKIITRDLYETTTKNLDFIITDPRIEINEVLFVDDIPRRIEQLPLNNIIVAEKFEYKANDNYLLNLIEILTLLNRE